MTPCLEITLWQRRPLYEPLEHTMAFRGSVALLMLCSLPALLPTQLLHILGVISFRKLSYIFSPVHNTKHRKELSNKDHTL